MVYCKLFYFLTELTVTVVDAGIWHRCLLCGDLLILTGKRPKVHGTKH